MSYYVVINGILVAVFSAATFLLAYDLYKLHTDPKQYQPNKLQTAATIVMLAALAYKIRANYKNSENRRKISDNDFMRFYGATFDQLRWRAATKVQAAQANVTDAQTAQPSTNDSHATTTDKRSVKSSRCIIG